MSPSTAESPSALLFIVLSRNDNVIVPVLPPVIESIWQGHIISAQATWASGPLLRMAGPSSLQCRLLYNTVKKSEALSNTLLRVSMDSASGKEDYKKPSSVNMFSGGRCPKLGRLGGKCTECHRCSRAMVKPTSHPKWMCMKACTSRKCPSYKMWKGSICGGDFTGSKECHYTLWYQKIVLFTFKKVFCHANLKATSG